MTEMGSPVRQLGDVAQFINGGAWSQNEYSNCGIPVVQVSNIRGYQIDLSDCKYLSKSSLEKYGRHLIRRDDLIIATVGSHPSQPNSVVGRPAIARPNAVNALLNQNAVIVRSMSDDVDQKWLGWLGRDQPFRDYIIGCARGSANQVRMSIGLLKQMPINIPPLRTQRRIAEILGAYDDLIEVNRRRIAVLDEMARRLFTEWFVRLRFPGHENVEVVGDTPVGWRKVRVGDVLLKVRRSEKVKKQDYTPKGTIPCIDQGADFIGGYTDNVNSVISAPLPMCVFGDHTRILKFVTFPFASGADGTQLLYPTADLSPEYLYFSLLNVDLSNQHYARHFKFLKDQIILIPNDALMDRFTKVAKPIMEKIQCHRSENECLAASRDLLLPRLISSQLSVTQAEREPKAIS